MAFRAFASVIFASLQLGTADVTASPKELAEFPSGETEAKETVVFAGMIPVLAAPLRFDGRLIAMVGLLRLEFEGNSLYLDQMSHDYRIQANSVHLKLSDDQKTKLGALNGKPVAVLGLLKAGPCGHLGGHSACLDVRTAREVGPASSKQPAK